MLLLFLLNTLKFLSVQASAEAKETKKNSEIVAPRASYISTEPAFLEYDPISTVLALGCFYALTKSKCFLSKQAQNVGIILGMELVYRQVFGGEMSKNLKPFTPEPAGMLFPFARTHICRYVDFSSQYTMTMCNSLKTTQIIKVLTEYVTNEKCHALHCLLPISEEKILEIMETEVFEDFIRNAFYNNLVLKSDTLTRIYLGDATRKFILEDGLGCKESIEKWAEDCIIHVLKTTQHFGFITFVFEKQSRLYAKFESTLIQILIKLFMYHFHVHHKRFEKETNIKIQKIILNIEKSQSLLKNTNNEERLFWFSFFYNLLSFNLKNKRQIGLEIILEAYSKGNRHNNRGLTFSVKSVKRLYNLYYDSLVILI